MEIRQASTSIIKTAPGSFYQSEPLIFENFTGPGIHATAMTTGTCTAGSPFLMMYLRMPKNGTINQAKIWCQTNNAQVVSGMLTCKFWKLNNAGEKLQQVGDTVPMPVLLAPLTNTVNSTGTPIPVAAGDILGLELTASIMPSGTSTISIYKSVNSARIPGCGWYAKPESTSLGVTSTGFYYVTKSSTYPAVNFIYTDGERVGPYYLNGTGGTSHTLMSSGAFTIWTGFRFYTPRRIRIFTVSVPIQRGGTTLASAGAITADLYWAPGNPFTTAVSGTVPASTLIFDSTSPTQYQSFLTAGTSRAAEFVFPEGVVVDPGWVYVACRQVTNSNSATDGYRIQGGTPTYDGVAWPFMRYGQYNRHLQFFSSTTTSALTPVLNQLGGIFQSDGDGSPDFGYSYMIEPYVLNT